MAQTTYFQRMIDASLDAWTTSTNRKPLLLRGARQVGKSSAVGALARRRFTNYVEVNFEKDSSIKRFFEGDIDVRRIVAQISARYQTPLIPPQPTASRLAQKSTPNSRSYSLWIPALCSIS